MMADMPQMKTRDMLGEALKVVSAHQQIRDHIAEHAQRIQDLRCRESEQAQSNEIVIPHGT
jgi:predicted ATP-grasp superfamily ATP-dependent carboligase